MDTDEYQISLSRELAVCRSAIRKLRASLARLEMKHGLTTDALLRGENAGRRPEAAEYRTWQETYDALVRWEKRLEEYEDIYRSMRR